MQRYQEIRLKPLSELVTSRPASPHSAPPPVHPPTPALPSVDERRLLIILLKNKEMLRKDIDKKRALIERQIHVEIQEMLSAELALRIRAERSKQEELRGVGRVSAERGKLRSTQPPTSLAAARRRQKKPEKNEKLLCICRMLYDNTKFYVGCEHCGNWFHGACVGVTEEMSNTAEEYVCPDCRRAELDPLQL